MATKAKKNVIPVIEGSEKTVDALYDLVAQVEVIQSKASVLEDDLKTKGKGQINGFGTVNMNGSRSFFQIQVKRPSITLGNEGVTKVIDLVGLETAGFLFDISASMNEVVKPGKMEALKNFIKQSGGNPDDFFMLERKASAKDPLLDPAHFAKLVEKEDNRTKIMEAASVKGLNACPSGGFKEKKAEAA
jgi:hypothetical protein